MKKCFFIGHRNASDSLFPALEAEINHPIVEYSVTEFIVGHYGHFDHMAAQAVRQAKVQHPEIILTLLLPYLTYQVLPEVFDGTIFPDGQEGVPLKYAIVRANRAMIDRCDYLIAYAPYPFGNSRKLLDFASKKKIHTTCL